MGKQNVVYSYNVILFCYKKEWSIDTCYNINKPWKHPKWNKPVTTEHVLYDSTYMKFPE